MQTRAGPTVDCSVIIPVYFNEDSLEPTLDALKQNVLSHNAQRTFEFVFVDDGSGDHSLDVLRRLQQENGELVRVVQLTRNFGQVSAILAGLSVARGRCAVVISADGQDPVELINEMIKSHFEEGYEVVLCARKGRDESVYRVFTSKVFYGLMRRLCFPNMPWGGFDYYLLGSRATQVLLSHNEAHPFLQGHILWSGFSTKFIPYQRRARKHGKSRWSFTSKLTYLIDGIAGFSYFPLRFISCVGIGVALLGFIYAGVVLVDKLFWGNPVKGWAPLMIVLLVLSGMQMLMLGVMGEYIWRILAQVRNRSPYLIEKVYDGSPREERPETPDDDVVRSGVHVSHAHATASR